MAETQFSLNSSAAARRHDLDWLRILALGVLILYHIGMYYVAEWEWHIKSVQTYNWLQDLMTLTNPWRMSLLFLLSAMALSLAQQRIGTGKMLWLRSQRLLLPLLFGMFVVVAPQVYFEALSQQLIEPGYLQFWWQYINPQTALLPEHHSPIGLLTWNHLWFLPYVWCYSMLLLLGRLPLNLFAQSRLVQQLPARYALLLVLLLLGVSWYFLRPLFPTTHGLIDDWYGHAKYFGVFVAGYLLAQQQLWWAAVVKHRRLFLLGALCCYGLLLLDRHHVFEPYASMFDELLWVRLCYGLVLSLNHWLWLLAVLGYAGCYLNRPVNAIDPKGAIYRYASPAILPWYLLHQSLIIVFASWLKPLAIPAGLEVWLLLLLTLAGCAVGYALIRVVPLLSWCCGLKPRAAKQGKLQLQME
ncbi:acyltransferase family protein [Rheinheimera sp.]|uniref:acyltransferase family protein n=1 Tax=Rheinheimera sp. TaxID=1869214 RepID=UPI0027B9D68D|nr:acyltransferase family protein [Rheinheimera sp.]